MLLASVMTELVVKLVTPVLDLSDRSLRRLQHASIAYGEPVLLPRGLSGCVMSVSPEKFVSVFRSMNLALTSSVQVQISSWPLGSWSA